MLTTSPLSHKRWLFRNNLIFLYYYNFSSTFKKRYLVAFRLFLNFYCTTILSIILGFLLKHIQFEFHFGDFFKEAQSGIMTYSRIEPPALALRDLKHLLLSYNFYYLDMPRFTTGAAYYSNTLDPNFPDNMRMLSDTQKRTVTWSTPLRSLQGSNIFSSKARGWRVTFANDAAFILPSLMPQMP